jgi:hypothetical protein
MKATSFDRLEKVYDALAQAIDSVGPEAETMFLAKLALALAYRLDDDGAVIECIAIAAQDLQKTS